MADETPDAPPPGPMDRADEQAPHHAGHHEGTAASSARLGPADVEATARRLLADLDAAPARRSFVFERLAVAAIALARATGETDRLAIAAAVQVVAEDLGDVLVELLQGDL